MQQWYVIQALSGNESKVAKAILEQRSKHGMDEAISDVVVPSELRAEVKQGKQVVQEKKLWPGYILVNMELSDEAWLYVKETNGVIDFLGGGKPRALPQNEVDEILRKMDNKEDEVVPKYDLAVGDTVKIVSGVFESFSGTILEVFNDKGRLSVMVSIFGRETRVDDLEFWQIEKVLGEE